MRIESTFNILALSGGGVRGIFQATFLKYVEEQLYKNTPLNQMFDMVVGTSTGAIVASALALGIKMKQVEDCYKNHGQEIFDEKKLKYLRSEWYCPKKLKNILEKEFDDKKMIEAKCHLIITATCLDNYKQKLFMNKDNMKVVDAIMSSTAAPFYFPCYTFDDGLNLSYMDGGLWANNPSLIAIMYAVNELKIPLNRIRLLSIGTTSIPPGNYLDVFNKQKTFNPKKIRAVISAIFNSSESYSEAYSKMMLPKDAFLYINRNTKQFIDLSDAVRANEELPKLACEEYEEEKNKILALLGTEGRKTCDYNREHFISEKSILNIGLADFVSSRPDHRNSDKYADLKSFILTAKESIRLVGVSLSDAIQHHQLISVLEKSLKENKGLKIHISLLNYEREDLVNVMSSILGITEKDF